MGFINDFLRSQPGEGIPNYNLMAPLGMGLMAVVVLFYLIRMKPNWINFLKGVAIAGIACYFTGYAHRFMQLYQVGFDLQRYSEIVGNLALAFTLLPLLAWLCAKTFNTSTGFSGDVVALTVLGYHVPGRFGCIFGGCCYGFPCEWGWYSTDTKANQFPTAAVESLFTLAILIFILIRICRKGYTPDGKNLPYFLLIYGICRFFSEITRESTSEHWIFWRFSDVHVHMLLMVAVGGLMLWFIRKKERAAEMGEESSLPTLKGRRR